MNFFEFEDYREKSREISNKCRMLDGCRNRMCVTDDEEELVRMLAFLVMYADVLYRLNRQRLYIRQDIEDRDAVEKIFEEN